MLCPNIRTSPESIGIDPIRHRSSVLLPDPDPPMITIVSPGWISRLIPSSTGRPSNVFTTSRAAIIGPRVGALPGRSLLGWFTSGTPKYSDRPAYPPPPPPPPPSTPGFSGAGFSGHGGPGGRVVTRADYVRTPGLAPPKGFCDPLPAKAFSHPINCQSCHGDSVRAVLSRYDAAAPKAPYLRCESCHWEKDAAGKWTHWEVWRGSSHGGDPLGKDALDRLSLTVRRGEKGREVAVDWTFDFLPHPIVANSYKWYAFRLEFLGADGKPAATTKFGLAAFAQPSERATAESYFSKTGEELYAPKPGERFARALPVPAGAPDRGVLRLTVIKRKPYFGPDSVERVLYARDAPYAL